MNHLPTAAFLRDLGRRIDSDYDRGRLETIADAIDGMHDAGRRALDPVPAPLPGSTSTLAGATITHRPDLAYQDQQAAAQGEPGYLPVKRALAVGSTHGAGVTMQEPAPPHPAEVAKVGAARR